MALGTVGLQVRFGSNVLIHQKDLGAKIVECWQ